MPGPDGLGPTPCPHLHHSWRPPGFGSRLRQRPPARGPGPGLVGRPVLFYCHGPTDGWPGVRGTVMRRSRAAGHSHVVRYDRRSVLGAVAADSLLRVDAASHGPGGRWALLCSAASPGPSLLPTDRQPSGPGRRAGPGRREKYCNGEYARDSLLPRLGLTTLMMISPLVRRF